MNVRASIASSGSRDEFSAIRTLRIRARVLVFGLVFCATEVLAAPLSAGRVERGLRTEPAAALQQYFDCSSYQGSGYEAVATGRPEWIRVAELALRHSDACYTDGIQAALGSAMQRRADRVLPLVGKTRLLSADRICIPFVSDELPVKEKLAELGKSRRAIQRTHGWRRQKADCLRFIGDVEQRIRRER